MYYGPRPEKEWEFTPLPDIDMGFRGEPKVDDRNPTYQPKGGNKQIFDSSLRWNAQSKVGSYDPKRLNTSRRARSDSVLLNNRIHLPRLYTRDHVTAIDKWENPLKEMEEGTFVFFDKRRFSGEAKVGSLTNRDYKPKGGDVKILDEKPVWSANPKVGSLNNITYTPRGGNVMIHDEKLSWNSGPKIDAENRSYSPSRGNKMIFQEKPSWNARSKVHSLDNKDHVPGGGQISIIDDRPSWQKRSKVNSFANKDYRPKESGVKIIDEKPSWEKRSKVNSLTNKDYRPKESDVHILDETPRWNAAPKVGSLDQVNWKPKDTDVDIYDEKLFWKKEAKVDTFGNINHQPGGGTKKIRMKIPAYHKGLDSPTEIFVYGPRGSPRRADENYTSNLASPSSARTAP